MPMMTWALALSVAQAGTAVWLDGTPDPSVTPGDQARTVADVAPAPVLASGDEAKVAALAAELEACAPLLDTFDGELAIIRRLAGRLDAIDVVRPEDADLIWRALMLQGLAVHRYFPELAGAEARDAGVSREVGGTWENGPWADAVALSPDRTPSSSELDGDAARLAFQEQRARAWLLETATIEVEGLPAGAVVHVDGRPAPGGQLVVVPGAHSYLVTVDGRVHARGRVQLPPGGTHTHAYAAVDAELAALGPVLLNSETAVVLPPAVVRRVDALDGPVVLVVPHKRGPVVFRVEGENAVREDSSGVGGTASTARVWVLGGIGLTYDGSYFVHNFAAGAPDAPGTVNALSPVLGAGAQLPVGPIHLGVGADLAVPVGEWHTLPTDDSTLRLRAHPHVGVGYGPVQATVGFWAPWHLGVGARAMVPITDRWAVTGAFVQGVGLTWQASDGSDFTPEASRTGFVGMAWRWPE